MAWTNPPTRVSERGAAIQPRYVYVTSLSKGFLVYNGVRSAQHTFFVKEYPGSTETWTVAVDVGLVDYFDVGQSSTDDNVIIVYSSQNAVYKLEVDFATQEVVSGPTSIFIGDSPTVSREKPPRIDYIKDDDLQYRDGVSSSETEYEVGDPADRLFVQVQADMHYGSQKFRFATQMIPSHDIALPFSNITGTILRYDGQTTLSTPRRLEDLSVNTYHLPIGTMPIHTDYGLLYDGSYTPQVTWGVPSTALTIEAWVIPRLVASASYIIGGTDIQFSYSNNGTVRFSFSNVDTHVYEQDITDVVVQPDQPMHIAVSHTWKQPDNTFMTINGSVVSASWITAIGGAISAFGYVNPTTTRVTTAAAHGLSTGAYVKISSVVYGHGVYQITYVSSTQFDITLTFVSTDTGHWYARGGEEDPGFTNITSDVLLSTHDYLHSMRILNVARTSTQIRNYMDGKSL